MGNFYTDVLEVSPLFSSPDRVSSMDYLEPTFRAKVEAIIKEAAALGHTMIAFETYRSSVRQEELYNQGASQLQTVGCHHYGVACDIVKLDSHGNYSWEGDFTFLGKLANAHHLVWGGPGPGNLNIGDLVHVQWCAFDDQDELFAEVWYPESDYVAWSMVA